MTNSRKLAPGEGQLVPLARLMPDGKFEAVVQVRRGDVIETNSDTVSTGRSFPSEEEALQFASDHLAD